MAANLKRWRLGDHPMVVAYYGAKRTRHPPLQLVQLPDITDLLVWAAQALIPYLTSRVNAPSLGQVTDLLAGISADAEVDQVVTDAKADVDYKRQLQAIKAKQKQS